MDHPSPASETPPEVVEHYSRYDESARLSDGGGLLERMRTQQILSEALPPPPATVVDVGSGPGVYSTWLAARGYEVHAIDPVPHHIEEATARAAEHGTRLASAIVADARSIDLPSGHADAVLVMGPLYHLQQAPDRLQALGEARRILRPGGVIAAAAINRFASALDGLQQGLVDDPRFIEVLDRALDTGCHVNPTGDTRYFTTAFFHHVDTLHHELVEAGFTSIAIHAVEGIGWLAADLDDRLADRTKRAQLLELTARLAHEPTLIGISPHLLAVGTTP